MPWSPADADIPSGLRTDKLLLRPLRTTDVELDYEAVIASRERLLVFSGGRWPTENFSLADNLADLKRHEQEHQERTALTYTVMNPEETRCVGCTYINPLRPLLHRLAGGRDQQGDDAAWGEDEALVHFWVRPDAADLDRLLLAVLLDWFDSAWGFSGVCFFANVNERRQVQLFEDAGLRRRCTVTDPQDSRAYAVYGRSTIPGVKVSLAREDRQCSGSQ